MRHVEDRAVDRVGGLLLATVSTSASAMPIMPMSKNVISEGLNSDIGPSRLAALLA